MGDMILQAQLQPSWEDVRKAILATSEQMKETDRRMKETDRIMKETAELVHANIIAPARTQVPTS